MRHWNMKPVRSWRLASTMACLVLAITLMAGQHAHAGTGGTEFSSLWTELSGWIEGVLGKVVTTAMVLVGIGVGIARQSLLAFAVGVGGGFGLYATPTVVGNIFTATLPSAVPAVVSAQPAFDLVRAVAQLG